MREKITRNRDATTRFVPSNRLFGSKTLSQQADFGILALLFKAESMNAKSSTLFPLLSLCLSLGAGLSLSNADEVKLKSGETLNGHITFEGDDIIKMEISISASIKETKVIGRADIATIVKDAPDDVEFNKVQSLVPSPPLTSAENLRKMLETGPDSFLKNFPGSIHVPKVKEIRETLAADLDKVERGYLKVEDDWYSPQDKVDYKELIDSRIRLLRMRNFGNSQNIGNLIAALREFEVIEENFVGSPAYPQAVELAKEIIPRLGRTLQGMSSSVEYQNAEYEKALAGSTPETQVQLRAARAAEDKSISDRIAADKKDGVKWIQLNARSKQAIDEYIRLAANELSHLQTLDTEALSQQADQLVEANKLIAADQIAEARVKIAQAAAITGVKAEGDSKSKTKPKSSKSKSSSKGSSSYIAALNNRIAERVAEEAAKEKAKAEAAKSEALTSKLKQGGKVSDKGTESEEEAKPDDEKGEAKPEATDGDKPAVNEFAALAGATKAKDSKGEVSEDPKKSKTKSKTKSKASDDEDDEEKPRLAPVEEEGGFSMGLIVPILTGLLILVVVVLKVFGIGGKKSEE